MIISHRGGKINMNEGLMSISEIVSVILVLVLGQKKLGVSSDEIKELIKKVDFSEEDANLIINMVDVIYGFSEQDEIEMITKFLAEQTERDIILLWKAVMLSSKKVQYEKVRSSYIGKDGKDYFEQDQLTEANDAYMLQLSQKIR